MSIEFERIRNKQDLKDALCMIHEDVVAFKFINNSTAVGQALSRVIDMLEG